MQKTAREQQHEKINAEIQKEQDVPVNHRMHPIPPFHSRIIAERKGLIPSKRNERKTELFGGFRVFLQKKKAEKSAFSLYGASSL